MSKLIGIVGASSTGKTTSTRNLDSDSTYFINVLDKDLPFKGYKSKYNKEKKNITSTTSHNEIVQIMQAISESRPDVKRIVLDDVGFVMSTEFFKRSKETG
jgi:uridine kinase